MPRRHSTLTLVLLPLLALLGVLAVGVAWLRYASHSAAERAQAFCRDAAPGTPHEGWAERAVAAGADRRQARWHAADAGTAVLYATFVGVPPFDRHICTLTAKDGKVVRAQLSALD